MNKMNNEPRGIRVPLLVKKHTGPIDPLHRAIAAAMDSGKRYTRELASHGWVYS